MATANVIELETCLQECLVYCESNPQHDFVAFYNPRLAHAKTKWEESVRVSDEHYLAWQKEAREDKVAWRKLAAELKSTQDQLRKSNAVGYSDTRVSYWDDEILADAVGAMLEYLGSRVDVISVAKDRMEALTRSLDSAQGEVVEAEVALRSFKRHVMFRSEALGTLNAALADFRISMRRSLGKKAADYRSIRWPMTLAPDEPVL